MENKQVGYILIGVSILLIIIVFMFQTALKEVVSSTCTASDHAASCPMNEGINQQTYLSLGIVGLLIIIGIALIFTKPKEKIVIKKFKEKKKELNLSGLDAKEREVIKILGKENGTVFQATLMEKLSTGKVGITRLLDKLEAKQLIERKRRGMNNIVVLRG